MRRGVRSRERPLRRLPFVSEKMIMQIICKNGITDAPPLASRRLSPGDAPRRARRPRRRRPARGASSRGGRRAGRGPCGPRRLRRPDRRQPRRRHGGPRPQRLRPLGHRRRLRLRHALHRLRRTAGARMGGHRGGPRDRDRARHHLPGLDLQRPRARPHPALRRGRAAARRLPERRRPSAFHAFPRHPFLAHGRRAGSGRHRAGGGVRLRVRRLPLRLPPLPLPRPAPEAAHPPRHVRRLHHRPRPRPPSGRARRSPPPAATARPRTRAGRSSSW